MINRDQAKSLLAKYLKKESLINHCYATALVMEALAKKLNEDVEKFYIAGYLHDIDLELIGDNMEIHAKKGAEILIENELPQDIVNAVLAHNKHKELESNIEKALWIADQVNGLIIASALMRPDKQISSLQLKSLKKKFKNKKFAAGVSREQIRDCELLGLELDDFLQMSIDALAPHEVELGLGNGDI